MALNTDKIKQQRQQHSESQSGQDFQKDRNQQSEPPKSKGSDLVAHQAFEALGKGITELRESRLNSMTGAIIESRKQSVEKHLDLLEKVESGEVDAFFMAQGLMRRREQRQIAPETIEVTPDTYVSDNFKNLLEATLDANAILSGFNTHHPQLQGK